jgi:hypothetical protein
MRFEILAVISMNITVLLDVMPCILVERLRGTQIPDVRLLWQPNLV